MDLQATLNGLGGWGVVIGGVLLLVLQVVASRLGIKLPSAPAGPTPNQPAVPATPEPKSDTPILDAVLNLIRLKLLAQSQQSVPVQSQALPVTQDIDHNTVAALLGTLGVSVPLDVGKVK